mgnify:CR=1 FL=1
MLARQNGVTIEHAGAGVSHHRFNFFPHVRFIAMHGAFGTLGLVILEGTFLQALFDVIKEFAAFITKIVFTAVVVTAVKINHHTNGFKFLFHSALQGLQYLSPQAQHNFRHRDSLACLFHAFFNNHGHA